MIEHSPIVLATANPDKVVEIQAILDGVTLLPRPTEVPEVIEDGLTLEDNARLKAVASVESTGFPAVADDTGLFVDALDGRPGIHAARYAGENATYDDNVAKLLLELDDVPDSNRRAQFRTVALLRYPDGREVIAEGVIQGTIATERRGSEGMGYDPVFIADGCEGRTFAEVGLAEKSRISHRAKAFGELQRLLSQS